MKEARAQAAAEKAKAGAEEADGNSAATPGSSLAYSNQKGVSPFAALVAPRSIAPIPSAAVDIGARDPLPVATGSGVMLGGSLQGSSAAGSPSSSFAFGSPSGNGSSGASSILPLITGRRSISLLSDMVQRHRNLSSDNQMPVGTVSAPQVDLPLFDNEPSSDSAPTPEGGRRSGLIEVRDPSGRFNSTGQLMLPPRSLSMRGRSPLGKPPDLRRASSVILPSQSRSRFSPEVEEQAALAMKRERAHSSSGQLDLKAQNGDKGQPDFKQ